jgi:putative N6-adenine-specific DNA methylase
MPASPAAATAELFAMCTKGLEDVLAREVADLGGTDVRPGRGSVAFFATREVMYKAHLHLRTAVRILKPVADGEVESPDDLYDMVRSVDWSRYMGVDGTLAVEASVRDSAITHSGYAALTVKDAVVDHFRDLTGRRPSVDRQNPDLGLALRIFRNQATLSLDATGDSLHKRGYRPIQVKSPLNEALAAGIVMIAGVTPDDGAVLADPMCGSGTLPIEAALIAGRVAPGIMRERFAFHAWPDFDRALWERCEAAAVDAARPFAPGRFFAADVHAGALSLARKSAVAAGVGPAVSFTVSDVAEWSPPAAPKIVVVNPPYGERLGEAEQLPAVYKALGTFLKRKCAGAVAYVLSGNPELTKHIGLKAAGKRVLFNGPIECRLLRYEIF